MSQINWRTHQTLRETSRQMTGKINEMWYNVCIPVISEPIKRMRGSS